MPTLLGLAFAAAVYPQLLAIVVVILTRPDPRRLLWGCYAGAITMSVGSGLVILLVFRDRAGVLGSSSHRVGAVPFLVVGTIGIVLAGLIAGERTRGLLGRGLPRRRTRDELADERHRSIAGWKARATGALARGSIGVAIGVGVILGVPGPFDVLALGRVVRFGYALVPSLLMLATFNLIKFALIELPILSYALDPSGTASRVQRFSRWMKANQIRVIAIVIGIIGVLLIGRGITRL
jgi:Sap, sulfolipid-1-addressing protein